MVILGTGLSASPLDRRAGGYEEPQVRLYAQADFRGPALVFYPGETVEDLADCRFPDGSRANDRVRSIEVLGGATLVVYEDRDFRGRALRTSTDVRNLATRYWPESGLHWANRISSFAVADEVTGHGRRERPTVRVSPLQAEREVRVAYRVVLDREVDDAGLRFYRRLMTDHGWTSGMVEQALRESEEYRSVIVDRGVRRAYREVLGREADPAGLRHYRNQILDHGWDGERVAADLRRSAEYRERLTPQSGGRERLAGLQPHDR